MINNIILITPRIGVHMFRYVLNYRRLFSRSMSYLSYKNPEISSGLPGTEAKLTYGLGPIPQHLQNKTIFYFDIDNCLYNRSTRIHDMMQEKIHAYFKHHLSLNDEEAHNLHMDYYKNYGLALEGLVRNHKVDALEYNAKVDDSLDLKSVLHYNNALRECLLNIKNSGKYDMLWLMTNAYKTHALRVITFLGIGDLFDGLTFCDYSESPIVCKPMTGYFERCFETTQITDVKERGKLSFVDDSEINVKAAYDLGFGCVYHYIEIDEEYDKIVKKPDFDSYYGEGKITILRSILDLQKVI